MLALAEYAYNNSKHASTKISPFYANYRFEPHTYWPMEIQFTNPASDLYGHYMTAVHKKLGTRLEESITAMRKYYDKKRKSIEPFKKGDLVMLNGRNIRAKHRCKKLDNKRFELFQIVSVESNSGFCKFQLPVSWKIHPVFNIDLLERYKGEGPTRQAMEIEADGDDWFMESIIASGTLDNDPKQHVYLVKWKDFRHEENTWETYENVADNNLRLLEEYYTKNLAMEKDRRFMGNTKKRKTRKKN